MSFRVYPETNDTKSATTITRPMVTQGRMQLSTPVWCLECRDESGHMISPQQTDADDLVIRMESHARLYAAINELSEVQRKRLLLHFVDELTYGKIAELGGVNKSAVCQSVKLALKELYKIFAE